MKKSTALVIGLSVITVFGTLSFIFPDNGVHIPAILAATVTLVSAYIGLQVTNNAVRGKCFSQELWNAENPQAEGK